MQKLLSEKEAGQIGERFPDHPLMKACRHVWPERREAITSVYVRTEDVFCEIAWLLDALKDSDESTNMPSLVQGLWSSAIADIAQWSPNSISLADRYVIASTIFQLAATAMSLHWHSYYCDTVLDAMLTTIDQKRPAPQTLPEQQLQARQHERLLAAVICCSSLLSDWANAYIDDPDSWITEEIEDALQPGRNVQKLGAPPGNPKRVVKSSFSYRPNGVDTKNRNARLQKVYGLLITAKLIPVNSNLKDFLEVFSGEDTLVRIAWTGHANELHYIISEWIKRGYLPSPKGGKWKVTAARFYHRTKGDDGVWDDVEFSPDELRQAGDPANPSDDLDIIAGMLNPDAALLDDER